MVLAFAVPAFLAYGVAHRAGPIFYAAAAVTLPPFIAIPAAIGVAITAVLVNVFPARRTRDILVLLSIVMVAVLYLLFRMLQPERLVNPEAFASFVQFLAAMQTPSSPFLPSTWAAEILYPLLSGHSGSALFYFLLLAQHCGGAHDPLRGAVGPPLSARTQQGAGRSQSDLHPTRSVGARSCVP